MPPPSPPPDLAEDAISEILLRLPPDEPQWLFRAALVSKPWLRTITNPAFLRRYRDFHGSPPLLGLLDGGQAVDQGQAPHFVPTTAVPALPIRESENLPYAYACPLDCRHGRVLLSVFGDRPRHSLSYYLVCDPVTGDSHRVPCPEVPTLWTLEISAAVFCTAAGCGHLDCHGGPFCVVLLFTNWATLTSSVSAAMYSSEMGVWRAPVELDGVSDVVYRRGLLIGDEIYYFAPHRRTILKYDWANHSLSVVKPQPPAMHGRFVLMVTEDHSLGLAGIEDSRLHLWSKRVSSVGAAEWVQCRVIDLEKMMPMANPSDRASVVGFAEGVGAIFVKTDVGLFMMELKSGQVRKVSEPRDFLNILPYMSFYTPGRGRLLQLARSY